MRYVIRTTIGLAIIVAGIVAISYAVYQLLGIGTCASGGPYVSARQCPGGIERVMLAIPISIFAMLFGAFLYGTRGRAPGADRDGWGSPLLIIWSGIFLGIAFASFWGVWGPDAEPGPGGKAGGLIVGFIFVPMGLAGLIPMYWAWRDRPGPSAAGTPGRSKPGASNFGDLMAQMERQQAQAAQQAASGNSSSDTTGAPAGWVSAASVLGSGSAAGGESDDVVTQLERIDKLRRDGAITSAEYERLKAGILSR